MSDNIWRTDCLNLGHQGENGARELKVYVTDWLAEYPTATIRLQILRPGEDVPYYVTGATVTGGVLTWIPSSADTGFGGYGKAELQAVQGETIVKSAVVKTFTEPCLPGTAGEVPPSMKPWTDAIEEAIEDIDGKLDAPETAGTAGQVLKLNASLKPEWGTGGGGGSDVTVTQVVSSGTKIATITVDETATDLYAPAATVTDVQVNGTSVVTSGVANIPVASTNGLGVSKLNESKGIGIDSSNALQILASSPAMSKAGDSWYYPIVPANQYAAVFYGLAKAAGDSTQSESSNAVGTYTDNAKAAIRTMLGVTGESGMNIVSLTGTVIDQTGAANTMYVCGEVTSLTFAAPASGICAIRFTSGTTATVATFTGVTAWMNGFDPTTLEANKTYEINILNGVGCAGWA